MLSSARMPITVMSQARARPAQPGDPPGGAVEISSMRHRFEMRVDHYTLRGAIAPGSGHVEIGRRVAFDAQPELPRHVGHGGVGALLAGAVRVARYPRVVVPVLA